MLKGYQTEFGNKKKSFSSHKISPVNLQIKANSLKVEDTSMNLNIIKTNSLFGKTLVVEK